ncbi:MAG: hypothetical protein IKT81_03150 [Clostridia bacterium]|nr:hypothetical protein [Clostridia bacterium]MBR5903227.1 hypothetical protein [Clostridia bacterium]
MIFKVADLTVEALGACDFVRALCADYICTDPPRLTVQLHQTDPAAQSIELLRQINDQLIGQDTFLMHCSALALDGEGYLFAAPSGTGKSTHAAMWRKVFKHRVTMINDDKPFVRVSDGGVYVFGSPWSGKHNLAANTSAPVKALCFLRRGEHDCITRLEPQQALDVIFDQLPRYQNPNHTVRLLELVDRLLTTTPLYMLECTPTEKAAQTAYDGMNGDRI